jgi:hypothetical protein
MQLFVCSTAHDSMRRHWQSCLIFKLVVSGTSVTGPMKGFLQLDNGSSFCGRAHELPATQRMHESNRLIATLLHCTAAQQCQELHQNTQATACQPTCMNGTLLAPGMCPEGRPGRGSGSTPANLPAGRASTTCSHTQAALLVKVLRIRLTVTSLLLTGQTFRQTFRQTFVQTIGQTATPVHSPK